MSPDPARLKITTDEVSRLLAIVAGSMPVPLPMAVQNKLRDMFAVRPLGLRVAAHMLCLVQRVGPQMAPTVQSWTMLVIVAAMVADKMIEDRDTSLEAWAKFFAIDTAELARAEVEVMIHMDWKPQVASVDLHVALAQITADT